MCEIVAVLALLVLALGLAVCSVAVALMAVLTVRWYRTQLSLALELVIRHQDRDMEYTRKAVADATAAGRIPPSVVKGGVQPSGNTFSDRAAAIMASEATDGEDVM